MFDRINIILESIFIDDKVNVNKLRMKRYSRIKEFLFSLDPWISSYSEALIRLKYNIERNYCIECGRPTYFKGLRYYKEKGKLYADYCSCKCRANSSLYKKTYKNIILNKYGVDNPMKCQSIVEKGKNTCKIKYGEIRASKLKEYQEKTKKTCYEKYGSYTPIENYDIKERIHETCYERYGSYSPLGNSNIFNKTVETTYRKYGVICVFNRKDIKKKVLSEETKEKRYNTMKLHNTFNTSQPEEELHLYIKERFPNVRRQYYDKNRYPYRCDFYIPSLDYFIELNAHWTHNTHPYDPHSIEDQKKVEEWKSKHTRFYDLALKCWTISDVNKRQTAKNNNLHYKEVWTLTEGKEFIDELCST